MSRNTVFKLFGLTIVFLLLVPSLVQHGMFMDGIQYAIVAKNLALGKGTFWFPYLSSSWGQMYSNAFLEHMPLTYFLQSKFFLFFGYSVFTEKIYCFCVAIICAFLIYKIWNLFFKQDAVLSKYWWLAITLWFITPSVFWSFTNNMLEDTVSVMVLASAYFFLKSVLEKKLSFLNIVLAGIFIFLASFSKGLPGLFPISFVLCFYFAFKSISLKKTLLYTCLLIFIPAVIYFLIYCFNHNAKLSMLFYFENRLLQRIYSGQTVDNPLTILFWLLADLMVNIGLVITLARIFKLKNFTALVKKHELNVIVCCVLYGFCGVLPLCLTNVQRAVYFVPALPFFGMAFAVFLARGLDTIINNLNEKHFKIIKTATTLFCSMAIGISVFLIGKTARDKSVLSEVHKIGSTIGHNKNIGSPFEIYSRWDFQFYLLRYYDITLHAYPERKHAYKLFNKNYATDTIKDYKKVNAYLEKYVLIQRRD